MGIGIANPVLPTSWGRVLHLHSATANGSAIRISDVASGSGDDGLKIGNYAQNSYLNNTDSGFMRFDTNGAEAMRIQSDGMLCVGTALTSSLATQNSQTGVQINAVGRFLVCNDAHHDFNKQNSGELIRFRRNATAVGSISVSSTATTYNTSSDYRLKTDAQPMTGATARLKALNPVNFEWISDGTRVDGFLAHEAQEVVPESVTGTKDALDEEGNPEYQGIDQSKLVPLLTAALQEALTKIEALEVRITNLEA